MAATESRTGQNSAEYIEPDMACMPRISKEAAGRICAELGYRVLAIDGDRAKIEPLQEGVYRYPPVRVQIDRDPDFVNRYINMGPSVWSDDLIT